MVRDACWSRRLRRLLLPLTLVIVGCGSSDGPPSAPANDGADGGTDGGSGGGEPDAGSHGPAVTAAIDPAAPNRSTGVKAVVSLSPETPGWTPHWTWKGPRGDLSGDVPSVTVLARGDRWRLTAWANGPNGDRVDAPDVPFLVGDAPPSGGAVSIAPAAPKAGEALSAQLDMMPTDVDGDPLKLDFKWEVNGTVAAGITGPDVPAGRTAAQEMWRVRVRAAEVNDPTRMGPEFTAEVTVGAAAAR